MHYAPDARRPRCRASQSLCFCDLLCKHVLSAFAMDQPAFYASFSRSTMEYMSKCFWDDWNAYYESKNPQNYQSQPSDRIERRTQNRTVNQPGLPTSNTQSRTLPLRQRNDRPPPPTSTSSCSRSHHSLGAEDLQKTRNKKISYKNSGLQDMPWLDTGLSNATTKRKRSVENEPPPIKKRRMECSQASSARK